MSILIKKKRLVTGIKPTGDLTLGNYLGIIKPLLMFQKKFRHEYEIYFFIADLHALTTVQDAILLKKNIYNIIFICLASGLDLESINLFVQSDVPQHSYLHYIMESISYYGEMNRMIQFKKNKNNENKNLRISLFTYPILMAADILLYDPDIVPVAEDQKQHLELTRTLSRRFNSLYGKLFKVPNFFKSSEIIKSLKNPLNKMSKSSKRNNLDDDKGCIFMLEELELIREKILKSVTDSDNKIKYNVSLKPGISNLLNIYSSFKGCSISQSEDFFKNYSYMEFKKTVSDLVVEKIGIIQKKFYFFKKQSFSFEDILKKNTIKMQKIADKKIKILKEKIGIGFLK
ncbi:tryptophan--tRNA ligase [Candidatus Phytoplasma palmae]|uniref:tryptophan--tRNA ligase n=1 Tax=Candidatus Phytoplasma palmae TaxID=85624 RepID=UPI003990D53C